MVSDHVSETVDEYVAAVDQARRPTIEAVRSLVRDNLPDGYDEVLLWGMPTYVIPMDVSGPTYNGKPLGPVAFAAQKRYCSLYLLMLYADSDEERSFRARWSGGKALDMGKSCVRFQTTEDLDLPLIAEVLAGTDVGGFLETYRRIHPG